MRRVLIFILFGPLVGLLIAAIALLQPVAVSGMLAFVIIGFLPALVPATAAAIADAALECRHGFSRHAGVALIGSAVTLAMCALTKFHVLYFSFIAAIAGGMSAAFCCWLHLRLSRCSSQREIVVTFMLIIATPPALTLFVRYGGFCLSQFRFVSNSELIAAGVAWRAHDIKGVPEKWTMADIHAFIRDNPGCCRITGTEVLVGRWVEFIYENSRHQSPYSASVMVNACGRKVRFMGTLITAEEMKRFRTQY